eukprot:CAMPEP_0170480406 /NCGR_PEP_ID=MMETSP0208-20121228/1257_1 /TAXON_ID=197538 /ORGANISM="Strombidium inclinatum, Strain S3" /LENGTH=101 /DNA_ID=CAMNT_0010752949 /DNA_START=936 /DNA_END=1241 /DNA_ORIENTATION=+
MIFFLLGGNFFDAQHRDELQGLSGKEKLDWAYSIKKQHSASTLAEGKTALLKPFFKKVFSLRYAEEPNYEQLRECIVAIIEKQECRYYSPSMKKTGILQRL